MILYGTTFAASFVFIALKAAQQRNVAFDHYKWVVPTSVAMAFTEVYVVAAIATNGFDVPLVLTIGTGSGLGAVTAMYLHRRFVK